jgi:hypothetical protein
VMPLWGDVRPTRARRRASSGGRQRWP